MGAGKALHAPTQSEAAGMLEKSGFERVRVRGSHAIFRNTAGTVTVVPCNHPSHPVSPVVWASVRRAIAQGSKEAENG